MLLNSIFFLSMLLQMPSALSKDFGCLEMAQAQREECQSEEVKYFLRTWVNAWGQGNLESYLSHYVDEQSPRVDQTYIEWLDNRLARVRPNMGIKITLELDSMGLADDISDVIFLQKYSSLTFTEESQKKLHLVRQNGELKISKELTLE